MDRFEQLVGRFSDMLGFFGKDEEEARMIVQDAIEEGFSLQEIKQAYKEALAEYV